MGNIGSYCCKDSPSESGDQRVVEQSRIWNENGSVNYHQYGACLPPNPISVYKIVLPKLIPVDIEQIQSCLQPTSSVSNNDDGDDDNDDQAINKDNSIIPDLVDISEELPKNGQQHQTTSDNEETSQSTEQAQQLVSSQQPAIIKEEYCPEQFERLRSHMLKSSEAQKQFKELLWSCIPWSAPGGKSGSTFLKTVNDQFILKEMSKLELQSFLSFADDYFDYIEKSYHDDLPSLLSTILGIYRIIYTNSATQSSSECYFMVMRNLFYKRSISQRFDLKGSMRNRLVNTKDPDNTEHVLMDENLLRISCENPLLIHAKSKQILNVAIDNDSKFLTSISVMDYSLLVGVDKENHELILGIIDYVRPFTWDKKIERVVKSVVSTELPTIIEPELYRERFCEAMDKYFESVPDDWR